MNNTIRVKTRYGYLVATPKDDPNFPGITISIERDFDSAANPYNTVAIIEVAEEALDEHPDIKLPIVDTFLYQNLQDDEHDLHYMTDVSGYAGEMSIWINDETSDEDNPGYDVIVYDEEAEAEDYDLSKYKLATPFEANKFINQIMEEHPKFHWHRLPMVKK